MGNGNTLKPSITSKNVQDSPAVQEDVIERIFELKHSGLGCRRISKQLKKEELADISKSSVYNILKLHVGKFKEPVEIVTEDIKVLRKLRKEVQQLRTKNKTLVEIKKLTLEKVRTREGLEKVFSSSESMVKFAKIVVPIGTMKKLKVFCEQHYGVNKFDFESELGDAIDAYTATPLKFYEEQHSDTPLDKYMIERIGWHIDYWQREDRKKDLQKQFKDYWRTLKCKCGLSHQFWKTDPVNGLIYCECGVIFEPRCLLCWQQKEESVSLTFENGVYRCPQCELTFEMPELTKKEMEEVERRQRRLEVQRSLAEKQRRKELVAEWDRSQREQKAEIKLQRTWNHKIAEVDMIRKEKIKEYKKYYDQIQSWHKDLYALNVPESKHVVALVIFRRNWPEPFRSKYQFTDDEKDKAMFNLAFFSLDTVGKNVGTVGNFEAKN